MKFFIECFKIFMNLIYNIFKLMKIQNKVTFISRQSDETSIDFKMLIEDIQKNNKDIKIVVLMKRMKNGFLGKVKYFFHMFVQMYHIATSKVVVLDSYCIVISILKHKKSLKVIQIWHALGSLKKFGYSSLDKKDGRDSGLAKQMDMHKNYTYILTSSEISKTFFREAFNATEEQMKIMSLPRVDFLQSEELKRYTRKAFYKIYPEVNNEKENILYCPTQRKDTKINLQELINAVNFEKYNLIIKLHNGQEYIYIDNKLIDRKSNFTGMELLHVANYVITDYSAIVYEAAVLEKPIYFYVYDFDTYMDNRGWYIDYELEMPGPIKKNIEEIIKSIEEGQYDKQRIIDFKQKYIEDLSKNVTNRLTKLILEDI